MQIVRQLLLRVPDDVHQRLAARAAREGRSINAVATEMLDTAADVEPGDPRSALRARAAAAGILRSVQTPSIAAPSLDSVRDGMRAIGLSAEELIDFERGSR
jgi:plasmid stability protein